MLLGVVTAGVYSGLNLSVRMQSTFTRELQAAQVLDNVVERLRSVPDAGITAAVALAEHELRRSQLGSCSDVAIDCARHDTQVALRVLDARGHTLALVRVPLK